MNFTEIKAFQAEPYKTLEYIREVLDLKGKTYMFVKNQNKKYSMNKSPNEYLSDEQADIIILNTLGKLNRVTEQAYYLRAIQLRTANAQRQELNLDVEMMEKAREYAEKSNLVDSILEKVKPMLLNSANEQEKAVLEATKNEPNIQYIEDIYDKVRLLKDKANDLIDKYNKLK